MIKFIALLAMLASAPADASSCNMIADNDQRMYCRARVSGSDRYCYLIKEADLRNHCKAITIRRRV